MYIKNFEKVFLNKYVLYKYYGKFTVEICENHDILCIMKS